MCNKGGSTSTSTVSIPPEIMAKYNAVYARAEKAADKPFQPYTEKFVAGLNETQKSGITGTSEAANMAQPYYGAATGLTLSGAQDVGPLTKEQIAYYQNPYTEAVANPTLKALQQQQGQERAVQQAQAIKSGAAFGDRSRVARAQLAGQQNLATASALAPIYERGYNNASELAKSQQPVIAADLARRMKAGEQIAGIGTTAQEAGLKGAAAKIAAGTVEQQTEQADLTAKYQQFLQERGFDFQTAQFLAGIALGFGTSSGSTTTSTQPTGFFSDERLKHDAHRIGETDDGLPIYSFKYNGDNKTQIGLMAQDVEKRKPEAVGLAPASDGKMYKTVDYDKATRSNKDYGGGVMGNYDPSSMGGAVAPGLAGEGFADGGMPGMPGKMGYVPNVNLPIRKLMVADPKSLQQSKSGLASAVETGKGIAGLYDMGKTGLVGSAATSSSGEMPGLIGGGGKLKGENVFDWTKKQFAADGGLIVPRQGYAMGGSDDEEPTPYNSYEVMKGEDPMGDVLRAGSRLSKGLQKPGGGGGGGGGQSGASQLSSALGLGTAAMNFGQQVPEFLAMFLAQGGRTPFAYGGLIPRQHHKDGDRVIADYSEEADLPAIGAQDAGLVVDQPTRKSYSDEDLARYARESEQYQIDRESRGDPRARAATSSAAGLGQFTDSTARGVLKKYPEIAAGVDYDPNARGFTATLPEDVQRKMVAAHARDQAGVLAKYGIEPTPQNVRMNWFLGEAGGPAFLRRMQEDPSAPAHSLAGADQVRANQGVFFKRDGSPRTASEVYDLLNRSGGDSAPRPPGLVGRSERAPSSYSGKGAGEASLGDVFGEYAPKGTPTSANFWVPALAGLGSMLASKNPTLLGAVGEGLVGGVSGYQSQKKQEQEVVKNIFDMVKDRFTQVADNDGNLAYRDKFGGILQPNQLQQTVAKILTNAGIDPTPYGMSRPQATGLVAPPMQGANAGQVSQKPVKGAAGKPVTETEMETAKPKEKLVSVAEKPEHELTANDYEKRIFANPAAYGFERGSAEDPNVRMKSIQSRLTRADQLARSQVPEFVAQANSLRATATTERDALKKDLEKIYGADVARNLEISKSQVARADKRADEGAARTVKIEKLINDIDTLAALQAEGLPGGGISSAINKVKGIYQSITGQELKLLGDNPAAQYEYAVKIAATQVAEAIKDIGGQRAPAFTGALESKIAPDPEKLTPGAIHLLLGKAKGDALYNLDRDTDFEKNYRHSDPAQHPRKFREAPEEFNGKKLTGQEKYNRRVAQAFSSLPQPTADPTMSENTDLLRKEYGHLGYEPKMGGATESAPAPAIPAASERVMDKIYTTPNGNFRWKGTGWERAQ